MKYKGFHVKITPDSDLLREDKDGNDVRCEVLLLKFLQMSPNSLR